MRFEYFTGPESEMSDFVGEAICSLCRRSGPCFSLASVIVASLAEEDKETAVGCCGCLAKGLFSFWHDTEIGMLDQRGLRKFYNHHREPPPSFRPAAIVALQQTPQYTTWQQETWLVHCDDFMVYEGTWGPQDFRLHAPDGDGRSLFLGMTDEMSHLWDQSIESAEQAEWYAAYYVFRCRHCSKRRGNWDCP